MDPDIPQRQGVTIVNKSEQVKVHDHCGVCGGAITYYSRRSDDIAPRTSAVNDAERWSHDRVSDWIGSPHRARPRAAELRRSA